jgi:hypothetical protein
VDEQALAEPLLQIVAGRRPRREHDSVEFESCPVRDVRVEIRQYGAEPVGRFRRHGVEALGQSAVVREGVSTYYLRVDQRWRTSRIGRCPDTRLYRVRLGNIWFTCQAMIRISGGRR